MTINGKIARTILVFGVGSAMSIAQTSNPASTKANPNASSQSTATQSTTPATKGSHGNHSADHGMSSASGMGVMVGKSDEQFLTKAAQGGMMEVEVGRLAQEKGSTNEVKEYGRKLEQDHSKANDQLKQIAASKNVQLPTDMGAEKASVDKLRNLSGDEFDKAFLKMAVKDHKKDVKEFEKESTRAMDSDVKNFASTTLPTLQDHLKTAEQLQGSTRGRKASSDMPAKTSPTSDDTSARPDTSTRPDTSARPDSSAKPSGANNPTTSK
jgi:putative membrane protein